MLLFHYVEIGTNDEDDRMLTDEELAKFLSVRKDLVDNIELHPLLDGLFSVGCINDKHMESILQPGTRSERIRALLDIIGRRSFAQFNQFVNGLHETFQAHVAHVIWEAFQD